MANPSASEAAEGVAPALRLDSDDFTLFGLPPRFTLDRAQLDTAWRRLQAATHPDRFASEGAAAQRLAMQWTVRVNEAYQRLKDPVRRAAQLCQQRGAAVDADSNTAMPAGFLLQQLQWREALEEATALPEVLALQQAVEAAEAERLAALARLLDEPAAAPVEAAGTAPAPQQAAQQVRALMFMNRFRQDIERRLDVLAPDR